MDLSELEWDNALAWGVAAIFTIIMYFFMFEMKMGSEDLLWKSVPLASRILVLIVGVPLYYVVGHLLMEAS